MLARYLVPGDLIHVKVGDRVPADVRLIEVSTILERERERERGKANDRKEISNRKKGVNQKERYVMNWAMLRCLGRSKG